VSIVAIQLRLTVLPTAVFTDMWAPLGVIEEEIGWSAEVLLSVGVIALAPVMDCRVTNWTEGRLVTVKHELMIRKNPLQVL